MVKSVVYVLLVGVLVSSSPLLATRACGAGDPAAPPGYHVNPFLIPMRDGIRLKTFVLAPDDTTRSYPFLLSRTPYDPIAAHSIKPEAAFLAAGYIFVTQAVRGRYGSEGQFVQMTPARDSHELPTDIDASTDTFDTIDWLIKNIPHNNGRVGLRGTSYTGFYAAAGMIDAHPALKAVSPQAPQADWFAGDDVHHNGAFLLASAFSWLSACDRRSAQLQTCGPGFTPPTPDGYKFFLSAGPLSNIDAQYLHGDSPEWLTMMSHGTYDELWQRRNLLPHLRNIRPAVLVVGGWYDANNLYGALHVFETVRQQSPATVATLIIGPWTHGQWHEDSGEAIGALHFGSATATEFIKEVELPFFETYLKSDTRPSLPVVRVFDTGSNTWRSFDEWPPQAGKVVSLHLGPNHSLSFERVTSAGSDTYESDPAHPVPFVADHGFDMDADYMAQDQRFASNRPDVLTYQTEPLPEEVTVIGPVTPRLKVSTSGTDSDWIVKVIDVHPSGARLGGFEELVRGDVLRGKFRDSFSAPAPMIPGAPTRIEFDMPDVCHTFKKGHRIRVRIQSSWFPLVDRNPQRFLDIYSAQAADFQKATQQVFYGPEQGSRIELHLLTSHP